MTEADLARIEAELGVGLPAHYRTFMRAYPPALRETLLWPDLPASDSLLFADPAAVIGANQRYRGRDARPVGYGDSRWPGEYLIVGMHNPWVDYPDDHFEEGYYDAYCIRLAGRNRSVWLFAYEEGGVFRPFSKSLADFEHWVLEYAKHVPGEAAGHAEPGAAPDTGRM
jgi:hypothetical protein